MNQNTLYFSVVLFYLSLSMFACGDAVQSTNFDVLVSVDKNIDNAPATLSFTAQNNGPLNGEFSYAWSFGDGEVSSEANPKHVYNQLQITRSA